MSEAYEYEGEEGEGDVQDAPMSLDASEEEGEGAPPLAPQGRDYEGEARRGGWKPQADFVAAGGDATKWVDAKKFVERGQEWAGALRQQVTRLEREKARQDAETATLRKGLEEAMRLASQANKQGYDRAKRELEAQQRAAAAQGDVETYDLAAKEIEKLGPPPSEPAPPAPPPPSAPGIDPAVGAFVAANPWFDSDAELKGAMIGAHQKVMMTHPELDLAAQLRLARSRVVQRYPESFPGEARVPPSDDQGAPAPRRPAASVGAPSGGGGPAPRRTQSAFDRITDSAERDEARRNFEHLKRAQPNMTAETYVELLIGAETDAVALVERDKKNAAR